jgi:L-asparaginase / beta-aspartyl-peptidase
MNKIAIAIHGGAGTILQSTMTVAKEKKHKTALQKAVRAGYQVLSKGGTSLDAVEKAVQMLENCPLFNAGKGSVFNSNGTHEMDAAIMEGKELRAGAVCGVTGIKNPVSLAKQVMLKTEHVLLMGDGALQFAKDIGANIQPEKYFYNKFRYNQWQDIKGTNQIALDHAEKKFGTVGAVALDSFGTLAAATSTGGMTNKKYGRIGDSPIIGAGTYANNSTCAISCTGHGEWFIKKVVAYDIACLMEYKNMSLAAACKEVVNKKLIAIGGEGGLIAIDKKGNIALPFNSEGMYRACIDVHGTEKVLIYK